MNIRIDLAHLAVKAAGSGPGSAMGEVLDTAKAEDWVAFDLAVRRLWTRPATDWLRAGNPAPNEPSLAVALCHPDGRIRQAALTSLSLESVALLPLVAVRCADWVAPVREAARVMLRRALPEAAPEVLVAVAAVILRVAQRRHGDFARQLLEEVLQDGEIADALLSSKDRAARRLGHRIAVERGRLTCEDLARIAARDTDIVVQDLCADAALARTRDGREHGDIVALLLGARQARVRAAGVTALNRTGDTERATAYLDDRSGLVRACARWVLRQHGVEPLPYYRSLCASAEVSPGAAAGLGECGSKADAASLRPLLAHPLGAVRARAVWALRMLDATDPEQLMPLLDDVSAAVVREASIALTPVAARLPEEWLRRRLAVDQPRYVRVAALRLLAAHGTAAQLRCFLTLLDDSDPGLRARACTALHGWGPTDATAVYAALPPIERAHLDTLLDRAQASLGGELLHKLRWYLGAPR
ncbi:hypothetical protein Q3V23_00845 [Streptomyces sp. VNUA116]|uniref:hypothetical protein n=1 Tax=Streptomyces sp. VNUA116 TaxID=3062449 RepID=UPI002674A632|nr:hypothetical protein [Streptomyces sp. VNUA116]WKU42733.1 hypothetical protein Q3V23_00845 [Streptomyces sp. VNUA116]